MQKQNISFTTRVEIISYAERKKKGIKVFNSFPIRMGTERTQRDGEKEKLMKTCRLDNERHEK